ncbi:MAG: hypothetical protein WA989_04180 [Henriciella sp.]
MSEHDTNDARQGATGFGMRWVLVISIIAAVIAMGILFGIMM